MNHRLQRMVEVLPSGPASPIWDLDGADSPIPSESCTMSTISDLVSSESAIGCSSPGLSSSSLLPDPCLGSIVDLGEGLNGEGGLFDSAQVTSSFSGTTDTVVSPLDTINIESCADGSETLKHSVDSYNLSDCNGDILSCDKSICGKSSGAAVFSRSGVFEKLDDGSGPVLDLHDQQYLGVPLGSSQGHRVTDSCLPTTGTSASFNIPVLLASSLSNTVNVSGALTVINLNVPPLTDSFARQTNTIDSRPVVRVGQQNVALSNVFFLSPSSASTTSTTEPVATSLQTFQRSEHMAGQYLAGIPCPPLPNSTSTCTRSFTSQNMNSSLQSAVRFPVILNPISNFTSSVPHNLSDSKMHLSDVVNAQTFTADTQATVLYPDDSSLEMIPEDLPAEELDTNRFLNLEATNSSEHIPTTEDQNVSKESVEKNPSDSGVLSDDNVLTPGKVKSEIKTSPVGTVTGLSGNVTCTSTVTIKIPVSLCSNRSTATKPNSKKLTDELESDATKSSNSTIKDAAGRSLAVSSFVRLIPPKKPSEVFKCDLCSATFNRLGNYSRHRMIHTVHVKDDFRYKCDQCDRMFLQKCDLKRHELIHEKKEPYKCSVCFKGYIRQSDLRVHMRFHNREKTFKCSYCPKSYYQSGDLNRHVRAAHLQTKMLTCGHCHQPYGYAKEATLIRHMQTKHKDIIRQSLKQKLSTNMDVDAGPEIQNGIACITTSAQDDTSLTEADSGPSDSGTVEPNNIDRIQVIDRSSEHRTCTAQSVKPAEIKEGSSQVSVIQSPIQTTPPAQLTT